MKIKDVNLGDIVELELKNRDNPISLAVGYVTKLTVHAIHIDMFNQINEREQGFFWEKSRGAYFKYDKIIRYTVMQKRPISE